MRSLLLFLSLFCSEFDYVPAEITATKFLKDPEALISNNTNFKLGFFSPDNSTNRFVGIWYNVVDFDPSNVVWVANKDTPLNDSSGALKISEDGDLRIINDQNKVLWSSNSSYNVTNNLVAKLLDSGNLVLLENTSETTLWQSFDHPTDSFLPPAKLTIDENMYGKPILRSWKSLSDPSIGHFSLGVSGLGLTEVYIWGGDNIFWRTGPWNGNIFLGSSSMYSIGINGFGVLDDHQRHTFYITFTTVDRFKLARYILEYNGSLVFNYWDKGRMWRDRFQLTECDVFGNCGSFGSCNPTNVPICDCLEGFIPKNMEEWDKGDWSSGCVRRMPLQCGTAGGRADGFWKLKKVKLPVDGQLSSSELDEDHCKKKCLSSCSCLAYAFYSAFGCMFWNESLIDIQELHTNGVDLYVRLDHSELGGSRKWVMTVVITVIIGIAIIASLLFYLWRYKVWKKLGRKVTMTQDYFAEAKGSKVELDLPLFEFEKLVIATNNFDQMNKLGEGGFGPVYKGKLEDGREIAVKRLSRASGQGVHEFMNEVHVISKLQHRNLVRLFGCCVEREEKLLVYEFMSNKSLDALLFDPVYQKQLDWRKRFTIIQGICRGILYLHRDSRLRIIHRDLKASNILLDEDLNPKISDFGTARIFGIKQDQANTLRVVGTYGYMSPEYAMDGRFSEKSDVYSFGVLLLEVINGRKNGSFHNEECHTLLGYAWKLWNEDKLVSLIDKTMFDPSFQGQIMRCIHVGLLCVQENPEDRPNMSMVNSMIENEETNLPNPVQPGFIILRGRVSHGSNNMPGLHSLSVNLGSGTLVTGR